jgi:nucleoside-diphosphate-sugar epimerase
MRILVTGATGLLGRALVPRLIARGDTLSLLVRDTAKAKQLFPGCDLLRGDVTLDGLGLDRRPQPDAVLHMAADINLGSSQDSRVWAVNYQGTLNVINFCLRNSVPRLLYAGTAYTEKDRNSYEKSKKAAEQAIEACALAHKTIFKIGILVPPEKDAASPTEGGFYTFLNGLAKVLRRAPKGPAFRIKGLPEASFNLVHTDLVADFMAAASQPGKFWLTHPDPVKLRELANWVGELLGASIKFEPEFELTREEALLHKISGPFLPYMWGDDFPSHLPGIPRITARFIKESGAAAIAAGRGGAAQ